MTNDKTRIVLVTGGTRGLGRAIAKRLVRDRCRVISTYKDSEADARQFEKESGDQIEYCRLDLNDEDSWDGFCSFVATRTNRLDGLVNCAGEIPRPGQWDSISLEAWNSTIRINLSSHFFVLRGLLELLERSSSASVVNIGSIYGAVAAPEVIAYSAAKGAIAALTKAMAVALAPKVRVNAMALST